MALETLKNVTQINSERVWEDTPDNSDQFKGRPCEKYPITVNQIDNVVSFKIQNGPIKEAGKNGCQLTELIGVAKHMIEELNKKFPCRENSMTITKLDEALMWQKKRTDDRIAREVEGLSKA